MNGPEPAVTPSGSRTAEGMCYVVSDEKRETRWKAVPHEVFHSPLRIQRSAKRTNHRRNETAIRRSDHSAGKSHNGETEREILSASTVNAMTDFRAALC